MTWNNRIFVHESKSDIAPDWYAIHETFYDINGKPYAWTQDPIEPFGETVEELMECLKKMLKDAERCQEDIIDFDSEPEGKFDEEQAYDDWECYFDEESRKWIGVSDELSLTIQSDTEEELYDEIDEAVAALNEIEGIDEASDTVK